MGRSVAVAAAAGWIAAVVGVLALLCLGVGLVLLLQWGLAQPIDPVPLNDWPQVTRVVMPEDLDR
jgi:hypothetical protein